tara:strand:- start:793 stop:1278 length:486 start_codon:yes stop_codon:yes gene_type:complete
MSTKTKKFGFTLIELLLVVSIFSLLTILVLPMMGDKDKLGIDIARQLLVSDIELAQIMAISNPDDEIVLCIQNQGWHIASSDAPDMPLVDERTGQAFQLTLGTGPAAAAIDVEIATNALNDYIIFNENGGLLDLSQITEIMVAKNNQNALLRINPYTGMIE